MSTYLLSIAQSSHEAHSSAHEGQLQSVCRLLGVGGEQQTQWPGRAEPQSYVFSLRVELVGHGDQHVLGPVEGQSGRVCHQETCDKVQM